MVGWVVWFASIVAAMLYALGFGTFFEISLEQGLTSAGQIPPVWLRGHTLEVVLALAATVFYTFSLMRRSSGGGFARRPGTHTAQLAALHGAPSARARGRSSRSE